MSRQLSPDGNLNIWFIVTKRIKIPTKLLDYFLLSKKATSIKLQPLNSVELFERILWALFIQYKFSSFLDLRNTLNRFRQFSCDFWGFRFFFSGSACFSKLAPTRNLPSWVKYYGKFESFGTEFRRTKFIAVETVFTKRIQSCLALEVKLLRVYPFGGVGKGPFFFGFCDPKFGQKIQSLSTLVESTSG